MPSQFINFDYSSCCSPAVGLNISPIDNYMQRTTDILLLGTPDAINQSASLGSLILLGVISEVEIYFKHAIGGCVKLCEFSRTHASKNAISFAAVDYYSDGGIEHALVESISFATSGEIVKQTKRLTGIDLGSSELNTVITQFDCICHLRHAAVHASGILGTGNVRDLFQSNKKRLRLDLKFPQVQGIIAICHNLIREYNRALFSKVVDRWLKEKLLTGTWRKDRAVFTPIYQLFYSKEDSQGLASAYSAYRNLRPAIRKHLSNTK